MDHGACNVIYVNRRARDEFVRKDALSSSLAATAARSATESLGYFRFDGADSDEVYSDVEAILSTFNEVHVCRSGTSCLAKISDLHDAAREKAPTIVLIDVPYEEEQRLKRISREPRTPSPTAMRRSSPTDSAEPEDLYGIHLLCHVSSEVHSHALSKLVIPIVVLSGFGREVMTPSAPPLGLRGSQVMPETVRMVRYLDAGAVDVLTSPLSKDQVHSLAVHAYRMYKEVLREESNFLASKRGRKTSWVGVEEAKPYAYLREAMVSNLLNGICNPEVVSEAIDPREIEISPERHSVIARAVGTWSFSTHDFTDDELLHGALLMLRHALGMPELERWRMSDDDLTIFLMASRTAYNEFVLYHNFRHVADVLQAVFYFLLQIGTLPPYPEGSKRDSSPPAAIATLLKPFDALTLLVSAIGHDVGHPGVNNAFLVALNAPLAQLYNDRSVLESFHCAAYSQILRRYWPVAFADVAMRKLMINSILATDMGLHFKYMTDLGNLQEKLAHNNNTLDGWNLKMLEEYRDLACGLLIKCADISNVARKFDCAAQWASILTDEFSKQGAMEQELNIPTTLFGGPPIRDNVIKMGESQIGFMNIFARPLFESVTHILPAMQFSVDELINNKSVWEKKIEAEKAKRNKGPLGSLRGSLVNDGAASPMSRSHVDLPNAHKSGTATLSEVPPPTTPPILDPSRISLSPSSSRRSSAGSPTHFTAAASSSRRSSSGMPTPTDPTSHRSSGTTGARYGGAENQSQSISQSRRGSADASLTTILVTQTPGASMDKKKNEKGVGARLRSLSPKKKTSATSSPEKRDDVKDTRSASTPLATTLPLPLLVDDIAEGGVPREQPHAHSEPAIRPLDQPYPSLRALPQVRAYPEANGAVNTTTSGQEKSDYLTAVLSNSSSDQQDQSVRNRPGKFGLGRFWRRRWRVGGSASPGQEECRTP